MPDAMRDGEHPKFTRADLWWLIVLLLLVVWTFRLVIIGTHEPIMNSLRDFEPWRGELTAADATRPESFAADPTTQTYPWTVYAHEHLRKGDFPLWNTRMFCGTPFVANRLTGLFDPLILLPVWLLPPISALSVFYFIHYFFAAWFMYLFLKGLGIGRWAAGFGAIAYIFQGAYVPWMGFIVADKAYLPMSFYYLHKSIDRRDTVGISGFIISFGLLAITAYPQMVVFAVYIFTAWVLFAYGAGFKSAVKRLGGLVAMLLLAFLLGAMQHLPALEFFSLSLRAQPEFALELGSKTGLEEYDSPLSLLAIFFPTLWGDYLADPMSSLPQFVLRIYNHAYVGILAAIGFLFFPMVWRDRRARFFTILALIGLSFIAWHSFYMFIVQILPGFRISTVKPDFLTLTFMIIVASFVLDRLLGKLKADESLAKKFGRVYGWLLGAIVGMGIVLVISRIWPGLDPRGIEKLGIIFGHLIFVWLAGALLYFYMRGRLRMHLAAAGIIVLLIVNLVPYHEHFMPLVPKGRVAFETASLEYLQEKMEEEGPFRIFRDRTYVLSPNTLMIYGLDEPGGFDSFISVDYAHFFRTIDPRMSRNSRTLDLPGDYIHYRQPFWSFLNIRYLLSPNPMPSLPPPWVEVEDLDLVMYENTEWLPRWFLVPRIIPVETIEEGYLGSQAIDPNREAVVVGIEHVDIPPALLEHVPDERIPGSVEMVRYGADELMLDVSSNRASFLVFSDTYFPGWRAWVDDEEVEIYRTDAVVKGIVVPEGEHRVRFLYDPPLYKIGWILFFIGLVLTPFAMKPMKRLME